ncbi:hypothetical protein C8J57DRAFT_1588626 [Mycena rebaudengoi]|nr:hypothetical protein C8J57DRAFT_1588626 [Mycena rebaudengoi]
MDTSSNPHSDSVPQLQLLDTSKREAPITTLPPELICEIFAWTLPAKTYMYPNDEVMLAPSYVPLCAQLKGSPWILGHVCQQWKAIALSFPTLWSSITIFVPTTPISVIPIVEAQLHRSADSLLDVFIVAKGTGLHWSRSNQECLRMLIGCCGRWRSLYTDDLEPIFDGIRNSLPLLKELVLAPSTRPFQIPFRAKEKINDTFRNVPSLSKVVLASSYWTPNSILPWAQLTGYNASFTPLDHFGHLGGAPNLVNCDITVQTHDRERSQYLELLTYNIHDYPQSGQTVTLHALRRLAVSIDKFLHYLVTPALDELYVIGACDAIQPFLDRSSLRLLRQHQCIIPLLENNPSLTTLQIDFSGGAKEMSSLISALTIDAASGGPCLSPNLTSISWADRKCVLSHADFVDMVQSRWRVANTTYCRRLRSVEILLGRVRIIKTRTNGRRLEAIRDEGLEVSIVDCRQVPTAIAKWRKW